MFFQLQEQQGLYAERAQVKQVIRGVNSAYLGLLK
jgi:hypothetical protein